MATLFGDIWVLTLFDLLTIVPLFGEMELEVATLLHGETLKSEVEGEDAAFGSEFSSFMVNNLHIAVTIPVGGLGLFVGGLLFLNNKALSFSVTIVDMALAALKVFL